jgi:hypothetical protein
MEVYLEQFGDFVDFSGTFSIFMFVGLQAVQPLFLLLVNLPLELDWEAVVLGIERSHKFSVRERDSAEQYKIML